MARSLKSDSAHSRNGPRSQGVDGDEAAGRSNCGDPLRRPATGHVLLEASRLAEHAEADRLAAMGMPTMPGPITTIFRTSQDVTCSRSNARGIRSGFRLW